jgi:hypothetical protein
MIGVMTNRKKQKSLVELKKSRLKRYDETTLLMQLTYRPHKRTSNFRGSSFELTQSMSTWYQSHAHLTKWFDLSSACCQFLIVYDLLDPAFFTVVETRVVIAIQWLLDIVFPPR